MDRCKIPRDRAIAFFKTLKPAGLSMLYPGDSMVITCRADGYLVKISILSRQQWWYHLTAHDSVVTAEKQPLRVSIRRCLLNGVLKSSLLDALQESGQGPALACELADIFAWDINFFLDPRKGDTFQVLYTQKFAEGRFLGYGDVLAARYKCKGKDFYAIAFADSAKESGPLRYYDENGKSVQKEFLKAPLRYSHISSYFTYHRLHPILGIVRPHLGIDYSAPAGTPVYAAADGSIANAGWLGGFGNAITIAHGGAYTTIYGHLSRIASGIRAGVRVSQGQLIGLVGSTGLSTGPHLDYRMRKGNAPVNPLTVTLPSKEGIGAKDAAEFNRVKEACLSILSLRAPGRTGNITLDIVDNGDTAAVSARLNPDSGAAHGLKPNL
jgi:murein DD-endopeptidase MepM/ murein hydrolase activator NlpD